MRKAKDLMPRQADRLGTIQGHRDGFGFVIPDDGGEDIFLSEREMSRVMHGDRVNVRVIGTDRRGRPEGQIVEVMQHVNKVVIGRLLNENGVLIVAPEDKRIGHDILIPPKGQAHAKLGQVVSVEIIDYPDSYRQAVGRVVEVLHLLQHRVGPAAGEDVAGDEQQRNAVDMRHRGRRHHDGPSSHGDRYSVAPTDRYQHP